MGFSGIGIWEILVILVVVLLVIGPNRLPGAARKLGQTIRAIKKASSDLTTSLTKEIEAGEEKAKTQPQSSKASLTENIRKASPASPATPEGRKGQPPGPGEAPASK